RAQAEQPAERGQNGNGGGHLTYLTVLLSALCSLSIGTFNSAGQRAHLLWNQDLQPNTPFIWLPFQPLSGWNGL
ncbi:hypothetical protein RYA05_35345, partial [Pseudomonas syringae pv. actinidiae]|nr:hypothetical protein [Pseudomonas syringae pv. actinidiae]